MCRRALIISYTKNGKRKMEEIRTLLEEEGRAAECLFCPKGREWLENRWKDTDEIVFVGAAGIAVRMCAPFVRDKLTDPAVVVVDEKGQFAVPVLSGHVGGGNDLAHLLARRAGAVPVITTATDVQGKFAVDVFARKEGLLFDDREKMKMISSCILEGVKVGIYCECPTAGTVPGDLEVCGCLEDLRKYQAGIAVTQYPLREAGKRVLALYPANLTAGIGCRKGVRFEDLRDFLRKHLAEEGLEERQLCRIGSVDRKAEEKGLVLLAGSLGVPFETWSAGQLENIEDVTGESEFVRQITGTGNVCERAALMGSRRGRLLLKKSAGRGMTLALAAEDWSVNFG